MTLLSITIPGQPEPKGSYRAFKTRLGRVVLTEATNKRGWAQRVAILAAAAWQGKPLHDGPVEVITLFRLQRPQKSRWKVYPASAPDLDKLARATLDALQGVVLTNDARVVSIQATKVWSSPNSPGSTFLEIKELAGLEKVKP